MTLPPAPDRWTIDLANAERMEAIAAFGFTERQAHFLLNVLLHSGVFVERQYCSFAGIVHGQKSTDFIKTLVERRTPSAITPTILHLCSAPCKALRFAPTAHTRGLRALTVPARR